ncbi:acetyl-CoA carboxylase biotin carboxyl carrier protein subunit [Nonomuraea sp. FMUSA5-5]|uniref:Biotin carboxyl carrier protein of acetyl-CoA carboxylase n=1 Tax=Nonomuraea composti TaxID=2720023 RepID=A0ABX1BIH1_9ACTN|nr:acetyl-CoA carboxylase biotin carboxyl carrier protein subunit [Nonomuraea sp. FMUSA5-5]NJP96350.1 acetyl-CoA carboxylase biotin carboxyl carrier protein subunit [Nonomuraea sp. FMUSA5-5]
MAELHDTVEAAARLLDLMRGTDVRRLRLAVDDVRIDVERDDGTPPIAQVTGAQVTGADVAGGAEAVGTGAVVAPLMGVFYQRPAPDQPPFVEVGQHVHAGEQVAIVEAMKSMNPVVADRDGVVARICVADGEVVEFEQPLLELAPAGSG